MYLPFDFKNLFALLLLLNRSETYYRLFGAQGFREALDDDELFRFDGLCYAPLKEIFCHERLYRSSQSFEYLQIRNPGIARRDKNDYKYFSAFF